MKNKILFILSIFITSPAFSFETEHNGYQDPRKKVHVCISHLENFGFLNGTIPPRGPVISLFKSWDELKSRHHSVIEKDNISFYLNHMPRVFFPNDTDHDESIHFSVYPIKKTNKKFKTNLSTIFLNFDYDHLFDGRFSGIPDEYREVSDWPDTGVVSETDTSSADCEPTVLSLHVVDEDLSEAKALESCKSEIKKLCVRE